MITPPNYVWYRIVAKAPHGYVYIAPDNLVTFDRKLEDASRFDSEREARNAILGAAVQLIRNGGHTFPVVVYETIEEVVRIESVEPGIWDATDRAKKLLMIREVSRHVADAYQWIMTGIDYDYKEWTCAALLPEWEFTDPDAETVSERLGGINLPCIISNRVIFLRREDDLSAIRLLFEDVHLFMSLEDGTILLDNRS